METALANLRVEYRKVRNGKNPDINGIVFQMMPLNDKERAKVQYAFLNLLTMQQGRELLLAMRTLLS